MKKHFAFTLVAALLGSVSSHGAEVLEIAASNCFALKYSRGKWVKKAARPLPLGTRMESSSVREEPGYVVFMFERQYSALPSRCVKRVRPDNLEPSLDAATPPAAAAASAVSTQVVSEVPEKTRSWTLELGVTSWQESLTLTDSGGNAAPLSVSVIGVEPGVSWGLRMSRLWEAGVEGALLVAAAEASNQSGGTSLYRVAGIPVFGAELTPFLRCAPGGGTVQFGVRIPLIARYAAWPVPPGVSTISPTLAYGPGFLVESRIGGPVFHLSTQIGFFRGTQGVFWVVAPQFTL